LLVEDHKVNQIIGRQMLVRAGSDVVMAENGEQGVRAWEEQGPFDIILMDYHVRNICVTVRLIVYEIVPTG
jgi:CheY-like chemotaxis protein